MNIPTINKIRDDYNKIVPIFDGVRDFTTVKRLAKENNLSVEFNGIELDRYGEDDGEIADFVRVNNYGNLDYIYFWYNKDGTKNVYFDVWCEEVESDFLEDITIDELENEYEKGVEWVKEQLRK